MRQDQVFEELMGIVQMLRTESCRIHLNNTAIWSNVGWEIQGDEGASFETYALLDGETDIDLGEQVFRVRAGDIFLIDNQRANRCANGAFTIFGLNYSLEDDNRAHSEWSSKLREHYRRIAGSTFQVPLHILRRWCPEITREFIAKQAQYEWMIRFFLLQLLLYAGRAGEPHTVETQLIGGKHADMVADLMVFLSENLGRAVSLEEVGRKYGMTPRYINRIFKLVTGFPVRQYHLHLRIERAKKLLAGNSPGLLDIALDLGFPSSQYFSYMFKKLTGMSPSEYRKHLAANG